MYAITHGSSILCVELETIFVRLTKGKGEQAGLHTIVELGRPDLWHIKTLSQKVKQIYLQGWRCSSQREDPQSNGGGTNDTDRTHGTRTVALIFYCILIKCQKCFKCSV